MRSTLCIAAAMMIYGQTAAAAVTRTYEIDPAQSFVSAYVGHWESQDAGSDGVLWTPVWALTPFSLSGRFTLAEETSPYEPARVREYLVSADLHSDAPGEAGFALAPFLAGTLGGELTYDNDPCFDYGFGQDPTTMWSCSGPVLFGTPRRHDQGLMTGGTLNLSGEVSALGPIAVGAYLPPGVRPEYEFDPADVAGLFQYQLVAVQAVPEPGAALMFGAGLAMLAGYRRRARRG